MEKIKVLIADDHRVVREGRGKRQAAIFGHEIAQHQNISGLLSIVFAASAERR